MRTLAQAQSDVLTWERARHQVTQRQQRNERERVEIARELGRIDELLAAARRTAATAELPEVESVDNEADDAPIPYAPRAV